jgi:hypothetical protein
MKIDWIRFHGVYGDCEFHTGKDGVRELHIEEYSPESYCSSSELRMVCDGDVIKVRSLNGANYDFQKARAA